MVQIVVILLTTLNFLILIRSETKLYDLNLDSVNDLYHRAAVMALIKARSKELLNSTNIALPEKVIFEQCSKNVQTTVALAKCLVPLLDLQNFPVSYYQTDSLSPLEKFSEMFRHMKNYLTWPNPIKRIVPVNAQVEFSHFYKTTSGESNLWKQPVPVKEFYIPNEVILENQQKVKDRGNPGRLRTDFLRQRFQKRRKRMVDSSEFEGLSNLEKIKKYYEMFSYVKKFMARLNNENSKFINSVSKLPFKFELKSDKNMTVIENVFQTIEGLMGPNKGKFSFMSPRILPILPDNDRNRKHILSPTLFSFHEKDGLLPLPNLLKSLNVNSASEKEWLETLLMLSGASKTLDNVVKQMEPEMQNMVEKVYPAILDLERIEENWKIVHESYTNEQKHDIQTNGYAFLESEQIQLLYSNKYNHRLRLDLDQYNQLNKDEKRKRIDEDIRKLAKLDEKRIIKHAARMKKRRRRRQVISDTNGVEVHKNGEITTDEAGNHQDYSQEGTHGPIHMITLEPWAFGSRIGSGVALEAVTLSPYAFFSEVGMPEALILQTLSPRAFIPAILSPSALIARILSPAAFRAEILSPRALTAFVLTPEALIAEVLSPKMLEARVLSPEALIIQVLSPSLIVPRILSPEAGALLILSPAILSPRILSGHSLTVEVLSPHILGGSHSSHEDEEEGKKHEHNEEEQKSLEKIVNSKERNHGHENSNDHSNNEQATQQIPNPWRESSQSFEASQIQQLRPVNLNQNIGQ